MNKVRSALLLIMASVTAFTTVSCSKDSGPDRGRETTAPQTVLTFWDENAGPSRTPYYMELIRRFEGRHPGIRVQYVGIPVSINKTKYDTAISSGSLPDVAAINADWIADFASKDVLLPLDRYFDSWPERDQIGPSFIEYNRSLVPDRKLYQLPSTFYFDILWYRSDWFHEAGIHGIPSWGDFFSAADKLTAPAEHRYGYSLRGADGSITQLTSLLYAYSGITEYFTADGRCTVNDPRHLEFLQKYLSIYGKDTSLADIASGYKEMVAAFDSGRAAMIQHNFGSFQDHLKALGEAKFNAALPPPSLNGNRVLVPVANGYGIFKTTRSPDAAWQLLSFLMSEESQTYWNSKVGQLPTNVKAWDSDYVKSTPFLQEALAAFRDGRTGRLQPPIYLPDYSNLVKQQLEPNFQKVLAGTMSPEDFLSGWAEIMEASNQQYRQKNGSIP